MSRTEENLENIQPETSEVAACTQQPCPDTINAIIRKRVYAAVALGFLPVPLVDLAGLTAIQIEMLRALCKAHNIPFKEQWLKSSASSLLGSGATVAAAPLFFSLFKAIPFVGAVAGATTLCTTGAVTTYAMGRVFDRHFRNGGTLANFDGQKYKTYFVEKMEEGKEYARKLRPGKKGTPAENADSTATENPA